MSAAAAIIAELHQAGLTVRAREGKVLLSPRERVTAPLLELVQAHKPAILEALAQEGGPGPAPSVPPEHHAPPVLAAPAPSPDLERRRSFVVRQLEAHPEHRYSFDVRAVDGNATPPVGPAPGPVSVVLAIRTPEGVVTGELHIPGDRWDMGAFLALIRTHGETP